MGVNSGIPGHFKRNTVKSGNFLTVNRYTMNATAGALLIDYSVMQLNRNSSKTDTFQKPTTYEPHIWTCSEEIISYARHEYGRVGFLRDMTISIEVWPLEKCQFSNCSYLIARHCPTLMLLQKGSTGRQVSR